MRQKVANNYSALLGKAGITAPFVEAHNESAWAQFTVQLENRGFVQEQLEAADVPTAVHYPIPLNRQPAVSDSFADLPVGDAVATRVMSLPMHPYMSTDQLKKVVEPLFEIVGRAKIAAN